MADEQQSTPTPTQASGSEKKDYTKWIVIGVVVLVVLYALQYLFSPARMAERIMEGVLESQTDGNVDIDIDPLGSDGSRVTLVGEDHDMFEMSAGENVQLPADWPRSVPFVHDAKLTYAGVVTTTEGGGKSAAYTTNLSVQSVVDYYTQQLPKQGWVIVLTSVNSDGAIMSATRVGEMNEGVMVSIGTSSEGTTVTLSLQATE